MADITYPPIEETTSFDAESLNSRFSDPVGSVREAINALAPNSVGPGALNNHHFLGGMVMSKNQLRVGRQGATHTYTAAQTGANYLPFNTAGGAGSGTDLAFTGLSLPLSDSGGPSNVAGYLVLADFHLYRVYDSTQSSGSEYDVDAGVSVRIEYQTVLGWQSIDRSHRWVSSQIDTGRAGSLALRAQQVKIPIRTLIVGGDITGAAIVTGIRATVNVRDTGLSTATSAEFYQCDLAYIGLASTRT